jgi:taurine dioxygenase
MTFSKLEVRPLSGALGAEIFAVDLAAPLDDTTFAEVHRAFLTFGVLCFREQRWTPAQQVAFARRFGALDVHPIVRGTDDIPEVVRVLKPAGESASFGVGWHSDNSFFEKPSLGSVLYGVTIPPHGGDTLYASMEKAYAALSEPMQDFLDGLVAVHSASRAYDPKVTGEHKYRGEAPIAYRYDAGAISAEVQHPVIRTHPETGRKSIYVNQMFTQRIVGLADAESRAVLAFLYEHCTRPEFTCRLRWQAGTVAMWDNRCVQHYAIDDYQAFERLMYRVTICGDRPR